MKYRVVFQGNKVKTLNWEAALFQDLGSSPASMEAGKYVDCYGSVPGHDTEQAAAEQAYVQAEMKGTPTWVCLPPEQRRGAARNMQRPVCRLRKALYGHPDSGTYWEQKCDDHAKSVGVKPFGVEWPSCYVHPKLSLIHI